MTAAQHHQIRACDGCKQGQGGPFLLVPRVIGLKKIFCCRSRVCKVFFCCAPLGAATFRRGRSKNKKTPWVVFFFFALAPCRHGASPSPAFPRGRSKKKTPWVVFFFFCCGPARTLTHSLLAWVAMPPPRRGGVFFAAAPPGPGWCFFCCCGPARTLTDSLWAGAISARPGWCFIFCCGPAGSF